MKRMVRNVRPVLRMGLFTGLVLGGAVACEQGLTSARSEPVQSVTGTGSISGRVIDLNGIAVAGAQVSTPGGASTTTGSAGDFVLGGLPATQRVAVTISADGYASTTAAYRVIPGTQPFREIRIARRGPRVRIDAAAGGVVPFADGGRITIPANAFAGVGPGGFVDVQVTYYDPGAVEGPVASVGVSAQVAPANTASSLDAAPGDFSAIEAGGTPSQLETAGAVDVRVTNSQGAPVSVAPGQSVTINFPDRDGAAAGTWGLYRFDQSTGQWVRTGNAPPAPDGTQQATVPTLDIPWNADKPLITTCITITVRDPGGAPRVNEFVEATGVNWRGPSSGWTDGSGNVDLQVRSSSTADVAAGPVTQTVSTPATSTSCTPTATLVF
jgi:hypothetical protein